MYKIFYKLQPTVINKMYDQIVDIYTYNTSSVVVGRERMGTQETF